MKDKKFVYLSEKSAVKAWAWCQKNTSDPLAKAYDLASRALGNFESDIPKIKDRLIKSRPGTESIKHKAWGWWIDDVYKSSDYAYMYRDSIGRMILDIIKREKPTAAPDSEPTVQKA